MGIEKLLNEEFAKTYVWSIISMGMRVFVSVQEM